MRRWKRSDPCFSVTNVDTSGGFVVKALDHQEAFLRAMRYRSMKGAARIKVRLFAGECNGSRDTSPVFFDV